MGKNCEKKVKTCGEARSFDYMEVKVKVKMRGLLKIVFQNPDTTVK